MTNEEKLREVFPKAIFIYFKVLDETKAFLCSDKWLKTEYEDPKTGHWIEGQTDNPNIHNILCSCCFEGYPSKGHANSQYTRDKFKYCPNCGADMREVEE